MEAATYGIHAGIARSLTDSPISLPLVLFGLVLFWSLSTFVASFISCISSFLIFKLLSSNPDFVGDVARHISSTTCSTGEQVLITAFILAFVLIIVTITYKLIYSVLSILQPGRAAATETL